MPLTPLRPANAAPARATRSDAELLHLLQQGDERVLAELYTAYRVPFLKWAEKHFGLDYERAVDAYQDATVALYENARNGKLQGLQASLKTYLFAIGKYLILSELRQQKRQQEALAGWEVQEREAQVLPLSPSPADARQELLDALSTTLQSLPEKSRNLIGLYYFRRLSMKEICVSLGYKNENVAKSTKLRCLGLLREALQQKVTRQYA
jgi:RNA polymerase sigma factor (sigma-70 family)